HKMNICAKTSRSHRLICPFATEVHIKLPSQHSFSRIGKMVGLNDHVGIRTPDYHYFFFKYHTLCIELSVIYFIERRIAAENMFILERKRRRLKSSHVKV